jgi:membrane-associated phospholipid phosphatase
MKPQPHEWFCAAFFAWMLLQLVFVVGLFSGYTLLFASLLASSCFLVACFPYGKDRDLSWRLRLLYYALAMNLIYFALGGAIRLVHPELKDAALQAIDEALIGTNLSLRLEPLINPLLTDALSLCYTIYFVYLIVAQAAYLFGDLAVARKYYVGLFSLYAVGYFGYSLVPALGPHVAMAAQFTIALKGGWLTELNNGVAAHSNGVDVFPSLHCGNSLYILLSDYQHKRWRFLAYLVPCVGLWISTVYLRYHYFIDVICGLLLGWLAWKLANWTAQRSLA